MTGSLCVCKYAVGGLIQCLGVSHPRFPLHLKLTKCHFSCATHASDHSKCFVVFQSSAATPGSSPVAVGRCNVSPCPGSVTAGQHVRTKVTRWTVPVRTTPFNNLLCVLNASNILIIIECTITGEKALLITC